MEMSKMSQGENILREKIGFQKKEVEVRGKNYTLQNVPLKAYYQMVERCTADNGNLITSKMYDEIFDKVVIAPKVSWDDFSSVDEIEELMQKVLRFLRRAEE